MSKKEPKVFIKIHFKRTWTEVSTGDIMNVEYSTETVEVDDVTEAVCVSKKMKDRAGVDIVDGIECKVECVGEDVIEEKERTLSKEEMFDFILNNRVQLIPDGSTWTTVEGKKIKKKYTVSINETGMAGFDLEDAINYYVNNRKHMK